MPDVSAAERGKRYFQVMKEKQAEKVIARIQKGIEMEWRLLSLEDVRALKFLLGEAWVYLDQKALENFPFHRVSLDAAMELSRIGRSLQRREIEGREAAKQLETVLHRFEESG
ncbi:MAG: hypothetical protein QHG99_09055 [Methanomicrobiales archaeon]|nr:hypothetical protein [Methanomicrobiales archaeon]